MEEEIMKGVESAATELSEENSPKPIEPQNGTINDGKAILSANEEQTQVAATEEPEKDFVDIPFSALDIEDSIKHKHTNSSQKKKKKNWSMVLFISVNVLVIALTAMFEFGGDTHPDGSLSSILSSIGKHWYFLVIAVCLFLSVYLLQTLKVYFMVKSASGKKKFKPILRSVVIGKYYDNITPLAIGGQPFQAYYLSQNGIPVGTATAAPIIQLFFGAIGFLTLGVLSMIFYGQSVQTPIRVMAYVGMSLNALTPLAILFFSLFPTTTKKICFFFINLLAKIHIIKDATKAQEKTINTINEYRISMKYMTKSFSTVIVSYVLSLFEKFSEMALTYFVMMACFNGVAPHSFLETTAMTVLIYAAASFIPTPGTAGASEGSFYIVFGSFWPMLIWRLINYYSSLAIGLSVIISNSVKKNRRMREAEKKAAESSSNIQK